MTGLAVSALALVCLPRSLADTVRAWVGPAFSPFGGLRGGVLDLGDVVAPEPRDVANLRDQVRALENTNAALAARVADQAARIRDLAGLRDALADPTVRLVPAAVTAARTAGGEAAARIAAGRAKGARAGAAVVWHELDRGAEHGVVPGRAVLTGAGLYGVVEQVGPYSSTVRLVTDSRSNLMVQVIKRRGGRWLAGPVGLATGAPDGKALTLDHVSYTHDVRVGDFVVTSPSADSALPPYLVIGEIVRSSRGPTDLVWSIRIRPRVAPDEVRRVYVVCPGEEAAS
jgi:cell shape-determining protein MreC